MCWPAPVVERWCSAARMPIERKQPGAEIGERHADLDRRAVGVAGHRHQAGQALRDQIEAALRRPRARSVRAPRSTRR